MAQKRAAESLRVLTNSRQASLKRITSCWFSDQFYTELLVYETALRRTVLNFAANTTLMVSQLSLKKHWRLISQVVALQDLSGKRAETRFRFNLQPKGGSRFLTEQKPAIIASPSKPFRGIGFNWTSNRNRLRLLRVDMKGGLSRLSCRFLDAEYACRAGNDAFDTVRFTTRGLERLKAQAAAEPLSFKAGFGSDSPTYDSGFLSLQQAPSLSNISFRDALLLGDLQQGSRLETRNSRVIRIISSYQTAECLVSFIVVLLEQRVSWRRIKLNVFSELESRNELKGVRLEIAGRFGSSSSRGEKARRERCSLGSVALNRVACPILFSSQSALTASGKVGVKVWLAFHANQAGIEAM